MPDTPVERAAEMIRRRLLVHPDAPGPEHLARDMAAAGLLVDADTERHRKIGRAVEALREKQSDHPYLDRQAISFTLSLIYAEAGVTTEGDGG